MKIFLAGASGALGQPLIRRLQDAGHEVWGLAHRSDSLKIIEKLGAHPVKGDALNEVNIFELIERVRPDVVIDQLTSLPSSPFDLAQRLPADRRLRLEGGGYLFKAAQTFHVQRYIQQLSGFYLDSESGLATETSPLRINAPGTIGDSARMYAALEKRILSTKKIEGVGLRYGFFYGPGTWYWSDGAFSRHLIQGEVSLIGQGSSTFSFIHIEDAAQATVEALTAPTGLYNVVDNQPTKMSEWLTAYANWIDSDAPSRIDEREALQLLGEESVYFQNNLTGASNQKARRVLDFNPRPSPWFNKQVQI